MLRGCPRCGGDVVSERDRYGEFAQCLQCGYLTSVESFLEAKKRHSSEDDAALCDIGLSSDLARLGPVGGEGI